MHFELPLTSSIYTLVELGGLPIAAILCLGMLIFVLFFERMYFLGISFNRAVSELTQQKSQLQDLSLWERSRIQEAIIAEGLDVSLRSFWLLKAAIVACPLVGLMGTVSGMIFVFDQIALSGTGNPRLMASGIFQATLPTMAGMLISIIGLVMQYILKRLHLRSQTLLIESLPPCTEHEHEHKQEQREPKL